MTRLFLILAMICSGVLFCSANTSAQSESTPTAPTENAEEETTVGDDFRVEDLPEFQVPPEQVAFYVSLEGDSRPPLPVSLAEWDHYLGTLGPIYQPSSRGSILYQALWHLLEAKVMMYMYAEKLPQLKERAEQALRKLERGTSWKRVVRLYTEDILSRATAGDQGKFQRTMRRYPLELGPWELEEGQVGRALFHQARSRNLPGRKTQRPSR